MIRTCVHGLTRSKELTLVKAQHVERDLIWPRDKYKL